MKVLSYKKGEMMPENDINLKMTAQNYKFLVKKLESLKKGIRMLGINQEFKKSLMEEIHTVHSIITTPKVIPR